MAYERQYYTNGDVLEARQLNHMESGIKENSDNVGKLSEEIEDLENECYVNIEIKRENILSKDDARYFTGRLKGDGTTVDKNYYYVSDFIKVDREMQIICYTRPDTYVTVALETYDSPSETAQTINAIKKSDDDVVVSDVFFKKTITITPSDAVKYVRVQSCEGHYAEIICDIVYKDSKFDDLKNSLELNKTDCDFEIEVLKNRCLKIEQLVPFAYKPMDKAKIVLTIDDANINLPPFYDLCHAMNIPLSPAIVYELMEQKWARGYDYDTNSLVTVTSRSVKSIMDLIIDDGGEILAHNSGVLTASSDTEKFIKFFKTTKINFEKEGYKIRGIIASGGTDSETGETSGTADIIKCQMFSSMYYDYSDLYGYSEPYNHKRFELWNYSKTKYPNVNDAISNAFTKLSSEINNKKLIIIATHGSSDEDSIEHPKNVRALLEMVRNNFTEGTDFDFTIWSSVYDEYKTTSLDIAIKKSAIKQKASGEVIVVTDSAEEKPLGLAIDGKSTQDGTPTLDNHVEIRNIGVYDEASGKYAVKVKCSTEDGSKETTATVYLDEPLRGIGEYKDTICQKDGVWGVERYRAVDVFDGSSDENWKIDECTLGYRYKINLSNSNVVISDINNGATSLNSMVELCSYGGTWTKPNSYTIGINSNVKIFYVSTNGTDNLEEFKARLAENPMILEYALATPTFTPFEDQTLFNGLSMFYPTTIISNDCNANMEVTYIADTKAYIDKKFAELATAMV